jgi:hypothetical protein
MLRKKKQDPIEDIIKDVVPVPDAKQLSSTLVKPVPFFRKLEEDIDS